MAAAPPAPAPAALTPTARPWRTLVPPIATAAALLLAVLALDWDLSALVDADQRARAWTRLAAFFSAFGAPVLSAEMLGRGLWLSLQTLSTALLGTALGAALGYAVALGASRAVMLGDDSLRRPARALRRTALELSRLALDVLRGVPDFAWALLVSTVPGPGPITGMIALGLSIGGILGRIYSELWDGVDPRRYAALRNTGAGRLAVFLYGIQPHAGRPMLSYTLMRAECAVRNATVIGVVGGGGLGAELFDEFDYGNYGAVVTLLLFMLALTAGADLLSNLLRRQLRAEPKRAADGALRATAGPAAARRRRHLALIGLGAVLAACALFQAGALQRAWGELDRIEWGWIGRQLGRLAHPDLSRATLVEAARGAVVPLGLAALGTALAALLAALLAYPASLTFQLGARRFSGESPSAAVRAARAVRLFLARAFALVARSIPEVAWVLILGAFFRKGTLAAALAIALHSGGVLARVFAEAVDDVPLRRLEQSFQGSRLATFLYGALPASAGAWKAYAAFQLEVNVRMGLVLGMIGVGGLGDSFHSAYQHWNFERMAVFLFAMILLTTAIDRSSRALEVGTVAAR